MNFPGTLIGPYYQYGMPLVQINCDKGGTLPDKGVYVVAKCTISEAIFQILSDFIELEPLDSEFSWDSN